MTTETNNTNNIENNNDAMLRDIRRMISLEKAEAQASFDKIDLETAVERRLRLLEAEKESKRGQAGMGFLSGHWWKPALAAAVVLVVVGVLSWGLFFRSGSSPDDDRERLEKLIAGVWMFDGTIPANPVDEIVLDDDEKLRLELTWRLRERFDLLEQKEYEKEELMDMFCRGLGMECVAGLNRDSQDLRDLRDLKDKKDLEDGGKVKRDLEMRIEEIKQGKNIDLMIVQS